jgi:hypothetical protein
MTDDRLSWIHDDQTLTARLNEVWPGWDDPNNGLASQLDSTPGWDGWDTWSADDKVTYLGQLLDEWYPAEVAEEQVDRLAWVGDDPALVQRLGQVWPGWAEADGLVATLDQTAEWNGWDAWEPQAKRDYLAVTLDAWYPPASEDAEPTAAEPAAVEPAAAPPAPTGLEANLTAVVARVLDSVPGASELSEAELNQILTDVLAKQTAALSS